MSRDYGITTLDTNQDISLLGGHPAVQMPATLVGGDAAQSLVRGTVMGKVTATGKYVAYNPDNVETAPAAAILAESVDVAQSEDEVSVVYVHGEFSAAALIWAHDGITDNEKSTALAALCSASLFVK